MLPRRLRTPRQSPWLEPTRRLTSDRMVVVLPPLPPRRAAAAVLAPRASHPSISLRTRASRLLLLPTLILILGRPRQLRRIPGDGERGAAGSGTSHLFFVFAHVFFCKLTKTSLNANENWRHCFCCCPQKKKTCFALTLPAHFLSLSLA